MFRFMNSIEIRKYDVFTIQFDNNFMFKNHTLSFDQLIPFFFLNSNEFASTITKFDLFFIPIGLNYYFTIIMSSFRKIK